MNGGQEPMSGSAVYLQPGASLPNRVAPGTPRRAAAAFEALSRVLLAESIDAAARDAD